MPTLPRALTSPPRCRPSRARHCCDRRTRSPYTYDAIRPSTEPGIGHSASASPGGLSVGMPGVGSRNPVTSAPPSAARNGADDPAQEAVGHEAGEVPEGDADHRPDQDAHAPAASGSGASRRVSMPVIRRSSSARVTRNVAAITAVAVCRTSIPRIGRSSGSRTCAAASSSAGEMSGIVGSPRAARRMASNSSRVCAALSTIASTPATIAELRRAGGLRDVLGPPAHQAGGRTGGHGGRRLLPAVRRRLLHHGDPAPGRRWLARALTGAQPNDPCGSQRRLTASHRSVSNGTSIVNGSTASAEPSTHASCPRSSAGTGGHRPAH